MKSRKIIIGWIRQMKRVSVGKEVLIGVTAGIMLAVIVVTFQLGRQVVAAERPLTIPELARSVSSFEGPLTVESSAEEVIALMMNSHTKWRTLQARAVTTVNNEQLDVNSWETHIQLEQYGKGHGEFGSSGAAPEFTWVSDGQALWKADHTENIYAKTLIPESLKDLQTYGPGRAPEDGRAIVVAHPLERFFPSMLSSFAFPHGLAQSFRQWNVEVVSDDMVAGRDVVVVLFQAFTDEDELIKKHKYWIDAYTGTILKKQVYAEQPLGWEQWYEQTSITNVMYDAPLPASAFQFTPDRNMRRVSSEEFNGRNR